MDRRSFIRKAGIISGALSITANQSYATLSETKIGIIGLDTLHSTTFTRLIHDSSNPAMKGMRVIIAYPYGSKKIESSASRIPQFTKEIAEMGVKVADSIQEVIDAADVIMLMTNDGTLHLEQITPVLEAGKKIFLNKPMGANLTEVIRIYENINRYQVPVFSSSALRFLEGAQKVRNENIVGKVIGAEAYSPQKTEPSHTDLYWYGIHGVEILYTLMGKGCVEVKRMIEKEQDIVIGRWADGRIGTYRGDISGRQNYGGTAYGTGGVMAVGPFNGYEALVERIVQFFRNGISPVDPQETLEIYTFMEAADESKRKKGDWVKLNSVYDQALLEAKR